MTPSNARLNTDTDTHTHTDAYTRVINPRLLLVIRAGWIVLVVLFALVVVIGTPPSYRNYALTVFPKTFAQVDLTSFGLSVPFFAAYTVIWETILAAAGLIAGLFVFWRKSDDWMALLTALVLVVIGATTNNIALALILEQPSWQFISGLLLVLTSVSILVMGAGFPNGRFVPSWLRWIIIPDLLWEIYRAYGVAYNPAVSTTTFGSLTFLVSIVLWGIGVGAQIYRYRYFATPAQRQQTKWIVMGAAAAIIGLILFVVLGLLLSSGTLPVVIYQLILAPVFHYGGPLIVILTITFSILRYRLYDVDLILNRSLVYGGLTLGLGSVFLAGFFLLNSVLGSLLGSGQTSLAAVIATAIIAGSFNPARKRLQDLVDKRFFHLRLNLDQLAESQKPKAIANPGSLSGTTLGSYEVEDVIGRGGMGEVYKGRQVGLDRVVAIKVLPSSLTENDEARVRFEREAKTVASLHHPNVIGVFDFGSMHGTSYMVMEYISGQELGDYVRGKTRLGIEEACGVVRDIADALDYAHAQGLVHRDVKPSNIMLRDISTTTTTRKSGLASFPYTAVLMDFGITKLMSADSGLTQTGGAVGTVDYMSPEQILSAKEVDNRADIYSLGIITFEMLVGQLPFKRDSLAQVLFAHLQQPPPDPRDLHDEIPRSVAHAVMKAMAKKPEERFATAGEFAAALSR